MLKFPSQSGAPNGSRPAPRGQDDPSAPSVPTGVNVDVPASEKPLPARDSNPANIDWPRGVIAPRPMSNVFVDTSTLANLYRAMDPFSSTWNQIYTSYGKTENDQGTFDWQDTIPSWKSPQMAQYQWLFNMIAKDYHTNATGAKTYSDPNEKDGFIEQALKSFDNGEGYTNVIEAAYAYAQQQGLLTDRGMLTERGLAAYEDAYGGDGSSTSSGGGGGYSYSSGGSGGGYSGGSGGGTVQLTNATSARGLLLQTMQGILGRNPTEREYKDFLKTLNESEMANPQTVSVEGDNAVYSGGIDAGVLAADFAKSADDYKETQANKFYNAFMGALAGGA